MSLIIAEWLLRFGMAPIIILRKRSPPVALAWLVVVAFLPVVGAVVYFLVGENRLVRKRYLLHEDVARHLQLTEGKALPYREVMQPPLAERYRFIANLAESAGAAPPIGGNQLALYAEASDFVAALIADIDAAEIHCHLLYYIFNDDGVGRAVAQALVAAVERKVRCRLLVDYVGSSSFLKSGLCRHLRAQGVQVEAALPVNPLRAAFNRIDLRNHGKIAVIDRHVAYTGSHNISEPIYPRKAAYGAWIDGSARLTGPAVLGLQAVFLRDWYSTIETEPGEEDLQEHTHDAQAENIPVQVLSTGPYTDGPSLLDVMTEAIRATRERVVLTTPYFVPNEIMLSSLRSVAARGGEVILVVPKHSDSPLTQAAGRSHYEYLLELGIKIYEFGGGLLHSKTLTVDREFAVIGSANLDDRSFHLNFETELLVYDTDFASKLHFLQQSYMKESEALTLEALRKRGHLRRLVDHTAKLISPLL